MLSRVVGQGKTQWCSQGSFHLKVQLQNVVVHMCRTWVTDDSLHVTGLLLLIKYPWNLFCNTTKRIQIVGCLFINLHEDLTTLNQNFRDVCFSA